MVGGMNLVTIRTAKPSEAPVILALLGELAAYEKVPEFSLNEEAVLRDMFGAACCCELAFAGEQAVGIAVWFWTYKSFRARRGLYVEDLFVRAQQRGLGIGKALLAHLAAKAHAVGGFLEWQVLDWNEPAITFYQELGARALPAWITYRLEGEALERLAP